MGGINRGSERILTEKVFLDAIKSVGGASPIVPEYLWISGDEKPNPGDDGFDRALGMEVDPATDTKVRQYWDGDTWHSFMIEVEVPQDLRGLAEDKPAADAVMIGTTYWSVDAAEFTLEVSNGTTWEAV